MKHWQALAVLLVVAATPVAAAWAGPPVPIGAVQRQQAAIASLDVQLVQSQAQRAAALERQTAGEQRLKALAARQARLDADLATGGRRVAAVVRFLYEEGDASLFAVLLSSTSFADFVTRFQFVMRIVDYDVGVLRDVSGERRALAATVAAAKAQQLQLDREAAQLGQLVHSLRDLEARHQAALTDASGALVAFDQALLQGLPGLNDLLDNFSRLPWSGISPDSVQLDLAARDVTAGFDAATLNAFFSAHDPQFAGFAFSFDAAGATLAGKGVLLAGPVSAAGGRLIWSPDALSVAGAPAPPLVLQHLLAGRQLAVAVPAPAQGVGLTSAETLPGTLQLVFAP